MTGEWLGGFVREPSGALALAEGNEGGWSGGFLRDKEGRLVVSGGAGGTEAIPTNSAAYGCKCDAKTLTDALMTSGSKVLADASGAYSEADVGKLAIVNGGGAAINSAATLSSTLGTGAPVTTLAVSALATAFPSGPLTIEQEGHTQQFFCNGAAAGATALPVTSLTPNFAYTSAATIKSWGAPLFSKIASVQSATEVTLETAAGSTLTSAFPGEVVYGTDNKTGLQAAITAAAGKQLVITTGPGDGYMYSETPKVSTGTTIVGLGVKGIFGPQEGTSQNSGNFPQAAPYLAGSVLIPAASGIDGLQITGAGITVDLDSFGIRFAGKWTNTGNGINVLPAIVTSTFRDNGIMASSWKRLKVFGHDGNHYAYTWTNSLGCTDDSCQSYGGGGFRWLMNVNNSDQYGNHTSTKLVAHVTCGGTAHGMLIENPSTSIFNMFRFIGHQPHFDQAVPHVTGTILPLSTQFMYQTSGLVDKVAHVGLEGNAGAVSQLPNFLLAGTGCGRGSIMGSGGAVTNYGTGMNGTPTNVFRQDVGTTLLYTMVWDLLPCPIATANVVLNESTVEAMTSPFVMAEETIPAGSTAASFATSAEITTAAPITEIPVNAIPAAIAKESWVTIFSGTHSQQWKLSAEAAAGATKLVVTSQTPSFNFPAASGIFPAIRRQISSFLLPSWFYQAVAVNAKFISRQSAGVAGS